MPNLEKKRFYVIQTNQNWFYYEMSLLLGTDIKYLKKNTFKK